MFTNTLSDNAQDALAILGKKGVLPKGTYLAGGSALALHFGHRLSVDFDLFTPTPFEQKEISDRLSAIGRFKIGRTAKNTLLGTFQNIKFSLFMYQYPLLFPTSDFNGIALASPEDIGAMKIAAVSDRGTKKDFIDLYLLTKNDYPLEKCFNLYDQKFGAFKNNIYTIITSLSYFAEAESSETPVMLSPLTWPEVKKFFESEAIRLGKKYL